MLKIEKEYTVKSPKIAKGIAEDLFYNYNAVSVKKTETTNGMWTVKAVLIGPYKN